MSKRQFIYPFYESKVARAMVWCIHWSAIGSAFLYAGISIFSRYVLRSSFLEKWASKQAERNIRIMWESELRDDDE